MTFSMTAQRYYYAFVRTNFWDILHFFVINGIYLLLIGINLSFVTRYPSSNAANVATTHTTAAPYL